jgi:hypothetical protein
MIIPGAVVQSVKIYPQVAKNGRVGSHFYQSEHGPIPQVDHNAGSSRRFVLRVPTEAVDSDGKDHRFVSL